MPAELGDGNQLGRALDSPLATFLVWIATLDAAVACVRYMAHERQKSMSALMSAIGG